MSQTLFISDLHLSEQNTHLNFLFDCFIKNTLSNSEVEAVYILGDFFDVWVGDDAMGIWERGIAEKLAELAKRNIPVYLLVGNRDFLLQESFVSLAKVTLLSDPTVINLYGKKIILKHGDDLCVADKSYQWFRYVVRSALIKNAYLSMPLSWRKAIATRIRKKSMSREMRAIYAQISPSQVQNLLQTFSADWVIHGHTHCPQVEKIFLQEKKCLHIILCDWNKQGNQLIVNSNDTVYLDYFD
jgi:UDP-2,3-diacylglucosamine hydrolase